MQGLTPVFDVNPKYEVLIIRFLFQPMAKDNYIYRWPTLPGNSSSAEYSASLHFAPIEMTVLPIYSKCIVTPLFQQHRILI
jgi:hypothetical protein